MTKTRGILAALLLTSIAPSLSMAEVPEQNRTTIARTIGAKGTYASDEGAYRVVVPREAATIVQDSQTLSPNVGLNSWVSFTSAVHHEALLTGQFLLLEDEVDPVLTAVLDAGLNVTGLADASLFDGPRIKALDVTGVGTYQGLASAFRVGLDQITRTRAALNRNSAKVASPELSLESSIAPGPLNTIFAMRGDVSEGVYRVAVGRSALLYGETVGGEMGISTWIAIAGTDDHAVAQGEFAATYDELQNLLKALRSKNFHISSIRNHTAGEQPQLLFVRFWQEGRSVELAKGLRYALDVQVGAIGTGLSTGHVE